MADEESLASIQLFTSFPLKKGDPNLSPPLKKGDLGGFSNPPRPPFFKGGSDSLSLFQRGERLIVSLCPAQALDCLAFSSSFGGAVNCQFGPSADGWTVYNLQPEILRSPWFYRDAVNYFPQSHCLCSSRSLRMTARNYFIARRTLDLPLAYSCHGFSGKTF